MGEERSDSGRKGIRTDGLRDGRREGNWEPFLNYEMITDAN